MQTPEQLQPSLITENQIISPLIEVLKEVIPTSSVVQPRPADISDSLKESLNSLFPEQKYEEKNIQKAKEILGETASRLTQEQLKDTITEIQYLVNTWLDDFERGIFDGQTLKELLHEKGAR